MTAITVPEPVNQHQATAEESKTGAGHAWLAVTRVAIGLVFLWAFVDKMFGLGYSTPSARAVIRGGSPTKGFLSNVSVGPLQDLFHSIAGAPVVDFLFMASLLGIGVAMVLGAGLRIAAMSNAVLMVGMWVAQWPPAMTNGAGKPTGSTNPLVDYHIAYALIGIVFAYLGVASAYGLGSWWSKRAAVRKHRVLL